MTIREYTRPAGLALLIAAGWLFLTPWTAEGQDRSRARSNSKKEATAERSRSAQQKRPPSSRAARRSASSRRGQQGRGRRAAPHRSGRRGGKSTQRSAQRRKAGAGPKQAAGSAAARSSPSSPVSIPYAPTCQAGGRPQAKALSSSALSVEARPPDGLLCQPSPGGRVDRCRH